MERKDETQKFYEDLNRITNVISNRKDMRLVLGMREKVLLQNYLYKWGIITIEGFAEPFESLNGCSYRFVELNSLMAIEMI